MTSFLQRLFGHPKGGSDEPVPLKAPAEEPLNQAEVIETDLASPTVPAATRLPQAVEPAIASMPPKPPLEPPQLSAACAQSVGLQRDHNEDSLFSLTAQLNTNQSSTPFGLYIVADGMGGHRNGEVASGTAVRWVAEYVISHLYAPLVNPKPGAQPEPVLEILKNGIREAQMAIMQEAPGGGTTLTAVLVLGEQLSLAHIGDSRAYLLSPTGEMEPLTRDHSLVKRLVEMGQITVEEAAVHPQRNVLYRALGQEPLDADVTVLPLPQGSMILICSDGLWGVVPEAEIIRIIQTSQTLQIACQALVQAANEAGGPDNITAILISLPE